MPAALLRHLLVLLNRLRRRPFLRVHTWVQRLERHKFRRPSSGFSSLLHASDIVFIKEEPAHGRLGCFGPLRPAGSPCFVEKSIGYIFAKGQLLEIWVIKVDASSPCYIARVDLGIWLTPFIFAALIILASGNKVISIVMGCAAAAPSGSLSIDSIAPAIPAGSAMPFFMPNSKESAARAAAFSGRSPCDRSCFRRSSDVGINNATSSPSAETLSAKSARA